MRNYVDVYEFSNGYCLMNWFKGYTDSESGAFVHKYERWSEIDTQTLNKIQSIYHLYHSVSLEQCTIHYFEYRSK